MWKTKAPLESTESASRIQFNLRNEGWRESQLGTAKVERVE
jgi:hypothetical protein